MLREAIDLLKGVEDEKALGLIQRDIKDCVKLIVISNALSDESTNFTEDRDVHGEQRFLELSWLLSLIENKDDFICDTLIPELRKLNNFREIFVLIPLLSSPPLREQALLQSLFGIRGLSRSFFEDQYAFGQIALAYSPLGTVEEGALDFDEAIQQVETTIQNPLLRRKVIDFLLCTASVKHGANLKRDFSLESSSGYEMFLVCLDTCIRWYRQTGKMNLDWLNLFDAYFLNQGISRDELVHLKRNLGEVVRALVASDYQQISASIYYLNLQIQRSQHEELNDFLLLLLTRLHITALELEKAQDVMERIKKQSIENFARFYLSDHYLSCGDFLKVQRLIDGAEEGLYRDLLVAAVLKMTPEQPNRLSTYTFFKKCFEALKSDEIKVLAFNCLLDFAKGVLEAKKESGKLYSFIVNELASLVEKVYDMCFDSVKQAELSTDKNFDDFIDYCIDLSIRCYLLSGGVEWSSLVLNCLLPKFQDPARCVEAFLSLPERFGGRSSEISSKILTLFDFVEAYYRSDQFYPTSAHIYSPLFKSSNLAKRIYPRVGNITDRIRSFVRYFLDHLDAQRWWNLRDREWWVGRDVAWRLFKFAYTSTSLASDPFDRVALKLQLFESESYLHGARGGFIEFLKEACDLLDQLTQEISSLESQNVEQTGRKVEFLCRLAIVQAKAFQGDPQSTLQEAQKLYENLPENLKSRYFALLDQARKLVSTS